MIFVRYTKFRPSLIFRCFSYTLSNFIEQSNSESVMLVGLVAEMIITNIESICELVDTLKPVITRASVGLSPSIKIPSVFLLFLVAKMGVMVPGVPSPAFESWGLEMRRYCVHRDYLSIFSNDEMLCFSKEVLEKIMLFSLILLSKSF